jgi:predicted PurR-regulated permease PerM
MHYSGWSKVSTSDLTGWILSDQLTKKAPESLIINKTNTDPNKIKLLEQVLLRLKNENNNLIAKIIDIKAINDKKIKEFTSNLNKVEAKGSQENIDLKPMKNQSLSDSNTLLLLIVGLILGLVVSFIFSRILRRRNNKLNIVSRSY